jgi:hypothetical protein
MAVFDKANLFIAGYNDEQVHIGDEGYFGNWIEYLIQAVEKKNKTCFGTVKMINHFNFIKKTDGYSLFYRTKCAPQKHYIPWTDETVPSDLLGKTVMFKEDNKKRGIITWVGVGVTVGNTDYSFASLAYEFIMSDGTPCGQEVEE